VQEESQGFAVQIGGRTYEVETSRGRGRPRVDEGVGFRDGKWLLRSPLTGVVQELRVAVGDRVEPGSVLVIIEAMKMLNELRSRVAGVVSALLVDERGRVEISMPLVEVSEAPAPGDASDAQAPQL
jgi:biotin carboxyl carrier protein